MGLKIRAKTLHICSSRRISIGELLRVVSCVAGNANLFFQHSSVHDRFRDELALVSCCASSRVLRVMLISSFNTVLCMTGFLGSSAFSGTLGEFFVACAFGLLVFQFSRRTQFLFSSFNASLFYAFCRLIVPSSSRYIWVSSLLLVVSVCSFFSSVDALNSCSLLSMPLFYAFCRLIVPSSSRYMNPDYLMFQEYTVAILQNENKC